MDVMDRMDRMDMKREVERLRKELAEAMEDNYQLLLANDALSRRLAIYEDGE